MMVITAENIAQFVVERVRPKVRVDGGDIRFERFENDTVFLGAWNECAKCPASDKGLKWWIEKELKRAFAADLAVNITRRLQYYQ